MKEENRQTNVPRTLSAVRPRRCSCQYGRTLSVRPPVYPHTWDCQRMIRQTTAKVTSQTNVHSEDPWNRITYVSVHTVHLFGRTGVLQDFDQRTPAARIMLFSGTRRGHRHGRTSSIGWGRVNGRGGHLGLPKDEIKTSSHPFLFPHYPSSLCFSPPPPKKKSSHGLQNRWCGILPHASDDLPSLIATCRVRRYLPCRLWP